MGQFDKKFGSIKVSLPKSVFGLCCNLLIVGNHISLAQSDNLKRHLLYLQSVGFKLILECQAISFKKKHYRFAVNILA
jgi:hypothetical protein